jgi:hypothetical protein
MNKQLYLFGIFRKIALVFILFAGIQIYCSGQGITVYQYRHVPADKVDEFLNRETTYWSKVAEKALEKGNLTFWALLQKVSGYDLPNSSNFLFVNTYNDLDKVGEVWDPSTVFPNVPMDIIETGSMSTITSTLFLNDQNWEQAADAQPSDFKYLVLLYHNASDANQLIELENTHWAPFIKSAMDNHQISQVGWGNATVLSPLGEDIKFNTVSYDIFPSLNQALMPDWDENVTFPEEGLNQIGEIELNRRGSVVYRLVKVVQPSN